MGSVYDSKDLKFLFKSFPLDIETQEQRDNKD